MTYPLVQELAAEGIPVRLTCGVLGFSTQAFYKWRSRPCSDRDLNDAHLANALVDLHAEDPGSGIGSSESDECHNVTVPNQ